MNKSLNKPFQDLLVVELTTYWAGPAAGIYFRNMGARVIKVDTMTGDAIYSHGRTCGVPYTEDENPITDVFNGGKECIQLDIKTKDSPDMEIMHKLLEKADVFITSTRLPKLKKLGLDYESIKDKYPTLVYGHVTGWGMDGPMSNLPGFDAVSFFGINGLLTDNLMEEGAAPTNAFTGFGDFVTGAYLDIGILTALLNREKTGKGDYVMTSLFGCGAWVSTACSIGTQYYNPWPKSRWVQSPMGQAYETKDHKYIMIFLGEYEKFWPTYCKAFDMEDVLDDPRYNTRVAVNDPDNCRYVVARAVESAKSKTCDEILEILRAGDMPCVVLGKLSDKYTDPDMLEHCLKNGYLTPYTYEKSGKSLYFNQFPVYMESQGIVDYHERFHNAGADTEKVLKEFA